MSTKIGFPYYYDSGNNECKLSSKAVRIMQMSVAFSPVIAFTPSIAMAVNATAVLEKVEALVEANNALYKPKPCIGPVSAAACAVSGACAYKVKESLQRGDINAAVAFACGIATSICVERTANCYGL